MSKHQNARAQDSEHQEHLDIAAFKVQTCPLMTYICVHSHFLGKI